MSGIMSLLNQEFLAWISRNKITFMMVVLLAGNVYQYVDRSTIQSQAEAEKRLLNETIQKQQIENIEYERRREERLEFLLQALPKSNPNIDYANPSAPKKAGS